MQRKVKLGVIGAGAFSVGHLDGIDLADNCETIAICDIDLKKAQEKAERFHIPFVYTDYHELLKREDIEAVTVPLPDQLHRQISVDALKAGKHVLCEKPMALNMEDCQEMIAAARESGKILMVGQIGRYTPCFNKAIEILESGEIGELFFVESEYAHDYSRIGGTGGWRVTPERHPVIGGGCHAVDLVRRIAGNPMEVFAYSNHKILTDWPVDDCTIAVLKFPNNVVGKVMTSVGCKRKYTMRTVIYGSKGTLIVDPLLPYITMYRTKRDSEDRFSGQSYGIDIPVSIDDHNCRGEVTDFCNAILENKLTSCTGEEGAATVAACLAIVESAATGMPVKVSYDF